MTRSMARTTRLVVSSTVVAIGLLLLSNPTSAADLLSEKDYNCLVEAIYYEAGSEELAGKIAVANVVLNRVKADDFPKTICGVVHEKGRGKRNGTIRPMQCAFHYHCQRKSYRTIPNKERLVEVHLAAYLALNGILPRHHENALYFYSGSVKPYWVSDKVFISEIGNHKFYENRSTIK